MNLIPLGKRIIVKKPVPPAENVTDSGIYLSPTTGDADNESKIVSIGDQVTSVKVGDTVIYPQYGYLEIEDDGSEYLIIMEEDLIAKRKHK